MSDDSVVVAGGANVSDVTYTAHHRICGLPIGTRRDAHQFAASVLSYMRRWVSRRVDDDVQLRGIATFLFSEDPLNDSSTLVDPVQVRVFQSSADRELGKFIHLSGAGVNSIFRSQLVSNTVSEVADEIASLGWGARPAVIVDLHECMAWVFYGGVTAADVHDTGSTEEGFSLNLRDDRARIDSNSIEGFLQRVYTTCLITPRKRFSVWHDPDHFIPIRDTEKEIQAIVMMMAEFHLETCRILEEPSLSDSRADVIIEPAEQGNGERIVLELKVLRANGFHPDYQAASRYSSADHRDALVKGIDQARDYRDRMHMDCAFVCAYDMRTEDNDPQVVQFQSTATDLGIELRHYFLYPSAELRRQNREGSAYQRTSPMRVKRPRSPRKRSK